jgi:hypothetical protein
MKPKTKTQAIALLMSKRWVSTLLCMQYCNTYKLSNRVRDIEEFVNVERRTKTSTSVYGFTERYMEYRIVKDERYKEGIKQLFKSE